MRNVPEGGSLRGKKTSPMAMGGSYSVCGEILYPAACFKALHSGLARILE